jgi:L-arabinose isomerase
MKNKAIKVGAFNVGLQRYWMQFPGLEERLTGYHQRFVDRLKEFGVEVVSPGLVDTVDKARQAAQLFKAEDVE